jgi:hypothetical protein
MPMEERTPKDEAMKAFREFQRTLVSVPVIDYPSQNRPYVLITDITLGNEEKK